MKAKKAMKKINKALDYDMDSMLMLGIDSDHTTCHELAYGEDETIENLILDLFEREPKIADAVLRSISNGKLSIL
ncbi:hypothetical protein FOL80_07275 [Lactobacillus reuteri]|uniref:hypothetical protein n=1 Tax=Limosilactobacillus reuteri TaxID=1598 RepID=UPI00146F7D88|nr:hypothetical protein [Limosilactobacillus reuteri]NMV48535.1 hypothetical protein [Limosilactobacillus reuteri]NMV50235.1 hypothetical protein [Limosilactobacillus reuteri]NMV60202.1 hypothetical protein [Limosilactobacillus reuteri]NMV63776.1 hypothetical protein [Limosilactobacillus reuteri]NMV67368.1 hypothetical protein [Limosilactobacillus reuteri]